MRADLEPPSLNAVLLKLKHLQECICLAGAVSQEVCSAEAVMTHSYFTELLRQLYI